MDLRPASHLARANGPMRTHWSKVHVGVSVHVLSVLAIVGLVACRKPKPSIHTDVAVLDARISGCGAILQDGTCEVPLDRVLRLWLPTLDNGTPVFWSNASRISPESEEPTEAGKRYRFSIPEDSQELRAEVVTQYEQHMFRIRLAPRTAIPAVETANTMRHQGQLDEAATVLRNAQASCVASACVSIQSMLARVELARGKIDVCVDLLRDAASKHRTMGRLSDWVQDTRTLVYVLVERGHHFSQARTALESITEAANRYPDGHAGLPFSAALIDKETGNLRGALHRFRDSERRAETLGLRDLARLSRQGAAEVLQAIGRSREALSLLAELRATSANSPPCIQSDLLVDMGWAHLMDPMGDPSSALEAARLMQEADRLCEQGCPDPHRRANIFTNWALAELQSGHLLAAQVKLDESKARMDRPPVLLSLWALDLAGHIALTKRSPSEALQHFTKENHLAQAASFFGMLWRSLVGQAESYELLHRDKDALEAYARAESLLDTEQTWIPLGEGRTTFLGGRDRSARQHVDLLLRLGRIEEAANSARRARARILGSLGSADLVARLSPEAKRRWDDAIEVYRGERERLESMIQLEWALPKDKWRDHVESRKQLESRVRGALEEALALAGLASGDNKISAQMSRPVPGDFYLVTFPIRRGWAVIGISSQGARAHRMEERGAGNADASLADLILAPFSSDLNVAKRIKVLAHGSLDNLDFHALLWRGAPLIKTMPVSYVYDVPPSNAPQDKNVAVHIATVVGDPRGNLPAAREEARTVADTLIHRGWTVTTHLGKAATVTALRDSMNRASFVHYAGHGLFAGLDGWDSALPLAENTSLQLGEILALPRVPPRVFLSGCDTARAELGHATPGLGLAYAFLAAGANQVVAAPRPVQDKQAARLVRHFYRFLTEDPSSLDMAVALQRAQVAMAQEASAQGWSEFRVLER